MEDEDGDVDVDVNDVVDVVGTSANELFSYFLSRLRGWVK